MVAQELPRHPRQLYLVPATLMRLRVTVGPPEGQLAQSLNSC